MSDPSFTDAIVLFGDSITEASNSGSLYQRVAEHYTRKLDVVNRGFAGYNTEWALPVLERLLAKDSPAQKIRLVTVWFGANDSTLETEVQHVPIERYKELLSRFVALLRPTGAKIVFITPPPFVPELWSKGNGREPGNTRRYADACLAVAEQEKLPCIDIHEGLIKTAGGSDAQSLGPYLYDGLHLTPAGYEIAFEMLMKTVDGYYPELAAEALPRPVAAWDTLKRVP